MKKYSAKLLVNNFPYREDLYDDVKIILYKKELSESDQKLIPDNLAGDEKVYFVSLLEELFTTEEVKEMKEYFESNLPFTTLTFEEKTVSTKLGRIGVSVMPLGSLQNIYDFSLSNDYSLNYPVCGYFDLRLATPIS